MPDTVTLIEALEADPGRFDFFQAVRLLEVAHAWRPRVGTSLRPRDDSVRFTQVPELIFAPTTLGAYTPPSDSRPARLSVRFFGLLGPNGPLPIHLTEYARDRMRNSNDETFARFLDIFHHRMVSLFYRGWADAQPVVNLDRGERDRMSAYVGSTFGLAEPALRGRDSIPDFAKLHFAGLLAGPTRHAAGLQLVLSRFFELPVTTEQWVGHWMHLPPTERSRLSRRGGTSQLGVSTVLGERVWDRQHKFRIVIGPLSLIDYERFLPGGDSLRRMVDWVRNYVRDGLEWDVNLQLKQAEVPRLTLGRRVRLGYTSWLASGPVAGDQRQLMLQPVDAGGRPRTAVGGVAASSSQDSPHG